MKRFQSSALNYMALTICACSLTLIIGGPASAQTNKVTDGSTPLGISPGSPTGSYALSDFESVNLYNGGLNFGLPLVKIAGRGSAGYTMVLKIETKWIVEKEYGLGQPNRYTPTTAWWGVDGQQRIYSVGKIEGRQAGSNDFVNIYPCGYVHRQTLTRLTFTAPDGTEYELRDRATNGRPYNPTSSCTGLNRGTVFATADGSSATFTSDSDISDYIYDNPGDLEPSGYLSLRDGTRYRINGGLVAWMRDRNGNKITFTYSGRNLTGISDSLNRQVTITYADQTTNYDQITFKGFGGATRVIKVYRGTALRSDFSIQTYQQLFPELNGAYNIPYTPNGITAVELPNGQQYQFYYTSYNELARVVLPTGGAIEYDYATGLTDGGVGGVITWAGNKHVYRRVVERRVYPDGGSGASYASRMTYSRPESSTSNAGYVVTDQYNSTGSLLNRSYHHFYGSPRTSFGQQPTQYPGWKDGREYQTTVFAADGTTPLRQVTNSFAQRALVSWWTGDPDLAPPNDPRLTETTSILMDTNQVSKQTFGYDDSVPFNNQNNVKEYDLGSGAPGALVRETQTTFITSVNYTGFDVSLLSLPLQTSVYDGSGVERARTTFEYDNYNPDTYHAGLVDRPNISGFDSSFSTSSTARGNITATTHYLLVNGSVTGSVTSYAQYDIAGNGVKAIDARGYATTFDYRDNFGASDEVVQSSGEPANMPPADLAGQMSYAFPFKVTNALGHTAYRKYDYNLGRPVGSEDANRIVTRGYFSDSVDRPTQVQRAVGTSIQSQTTFSYDDANHIVTTTSDQTTNNDNVLKSQTLFDGLGRTIETRQYEGGTNYIAVQTQYDDLGRAYRTSNPFRPWQSESAVWTQSAFDALSRVTSVTTPDGAVVSSVYSGNQVTVTDQANKARKSVTDALGRLTSVDEDPSGLNYSTSYSYDVLDNLTTVSQGVQTRTFAYDSLKRLTSATNPESGMVSYSYDNNGNLLTKTDARSIVSTFAYDGLNRVTSRSHSDGTPTVTYTYDSASVANSKGRLTSVSSSVSTANYLAYDALGGITSGNQVTDGQTYSMSYVYDLGGRQTSMTYPSGRVITSEYDEAGRLAGVRDQSSGVYYAGAASVDATNRLQYAAHGAVSVMKLGNGLWEHASFNNRLQPTQIGLGTSGTDSSTMGLSYNYGTTDNNGNLQSVSYSGGGLSYTQNFGYDSLNRLTTSSENSGSSWSQTNGYDQYGNRWIDFGGGVHNLSFNSMTNRITTTGHTYDASGNLISDSIHSYDFDAENKVKSVDGVNDVYRYDGDGNRVRKNFALGEQVRMVYSGGQMIAEYDLANGTLQKEYVYGAKGLIATIEPSTGTRYTTSDHLGSPRVVTNSSAGVVSRHDYMPFGEELGVTVGGRTSGMGYGVADNVRQKFASKERDIETGLDYSIARYYSYAQGRFTSPDEFSGGPDELYDFADDASDNPTFYADLEEPQSLNKYQYTYNNPLNMTDDDGHCPACVVVVVVVAIEILSAPDTVNAPGPRDRVYPSGDGVNTLFANVAVGTLGGAAVKRFGGALVSKMLGREGAEAASKSVRRGVGEGVAGRGSRNPKVAEKLAEGRAKHGELATRVKAKPGYKSEPTLKDPLTGKTVKPDVVTKSGRPLELKPNTATGRAAGRRQLPAQERATGRKGRVIYYEPKQ